MKGLPEHEETLGELTKAPEPEQPKDEGWVTVRPGLERNAEGRFKTVSTDPWGPV